MKFSEACGIGCGLILGGLVLGTLIAWVCQIEIQIGWLLGIGIAGIVYRAAQLVSTEGKQK